MNKKLPILIVWLLLMALCCSACSQASPAASDASATTPFPSATEPPATSAPVSTPEVTSSTPSEAASATVAPETTVRADPEGVVSFVEEFLTRCAHVEWLYEDLELASYFAEPLSDQAVDFLKTIEEHKASRMGNGTYRSHFYVGFDKHSIRRVKDQYVIALNKRVTFIILEITATLPGYTFATGDGSTHPNETLYEDTYTITVQGTPGNFRITSISTPIGGAAY